MKTIIPISIFLLLFAQGLFSQTQLDIQGDASSTSTVAKIKVNYSGSSHVTGLFVESPVQNDKSTGGLFYGGKYGVSSFSPEGVGIFGDALDGIGVKGYSWVGIGMDALSEFDFGLNAESYVFHGAQFKGGDGNFADIVLKGSDYINGGDSDDGVIMSDPSKGGSDIFLVANDKVVVELDNDSSQTGEFWILDDTNGVIFRVIEDGTVKVNGSTVHSSDRRAKHNIDPIDYTDVLKKISQLPVYKWQYRGQERDHIGPMAQDFHEAFGLGNDSTSIAAIDADGVALAAIKALHQLIEEQQLEIEVLKTKIMALQALEAKLKE